MDTANVKVYSNDSELPQEIAEVVSAAREALKVAYAPYSNFLVGAAALLDNGEVVMGSNFENASYPLCLCAERVALASVHSQYPGATVKVMAVTAKNPKQEITEPVAPCGACRQVLLEYEQKQKAPMQIVMFGESGKLAVYKSAAGLLPMAFDHSFLTE